VRARPEVEPHVAQLLQFRVQSQEPDRLRLALVVRERVLLVVRIPDELGEQVAVVVFSDLHARARRRHGGDDGAVRVVLQKLELSLRPREDPQHGRHEVRSVPHEPRLVRAARNGPVRQRLPLELAPRQGEHREQCHPTPLQQPRRNSANAHGSSPGPWATASTAGASPAEPQDADSFVRGTLRPGLGHPSGSPGLSSRGPGSPGATRSAARSRQPRARPVGLRGPRRGLLGATLRPVPARAVWRWNILDVGPRSRDAVGASHRARVMWPGRAGPWIVLLGMPERWCVRSTADRTPRPDHCRRSIWTGHRSWRLNAAVTAGLKRRRTVATSLPHFAIWAPWSR
jgi:hypothetical protein